jgi:signal transduction histidine kinase
MKSFIIEHLDEILSEWEVFAGTMSPAADTMDVAALRDHAKQMLEAIARDIQTSQSSREQDLKSRGLAARQDPNSAASAHGALRQHVGFDLNQLVAEFRALRASVLRIWLSKKGYGDEPTAYEIARFNEAIDQALSESVATYSVELGRARDTFIGILGHDLRTPLAAVWGAVEVLAKSSTQPARSTAYQAANRSLSAMTAMIRDLLDYTRTRLGKGIPIVPDTANLEEICKACIAEMSLAHPRSSFAVSCTGRMDGRFDSARLHQVISNLLGNAIQHGEPGSKVMLRANVEGATITLQVTNRGPAIPPEQLHSVFEPMVQGEVADAARPRSTSLGLGLFIAREIVHAHGGEITVSSSEAGGTTFAVRLPHGREAVPAS